MNQQLYYQQMFRFYRKLANIFKSNKAVEQQLTKQSSFYDSNRKQVLQHYRYLLKELPSLYPRKLQQRTIYMEICHLFHASKVLSSIEQTADRSNHLRQFVNTIKGGDHTVIGQMLPARGGEYAYLRMHFNMMKFRLQ